MLKKKMHRTYIEKILKTTFAFVYNVYVLTARTCMYITCCHSGFIPYGFFCW